MVAGFGDGEGAADVAGAAARLRVRCGELAESDLESYAGVLQALGRAPEDPDRSAALAGALSGACDVPLAIAQTARDICLLAARAADGASRWLAGDAATAAVLAHGACRAAAGLVEANLRDLTDERPGRAAQYVAEAEVACQQALSLATES
jgi:formiminotetrahydrofolate cyclodeaminase